VTKPLPTKPGINGANVLSIPTEWDATWFRKFINNSLKGADVRNAIAGPGITISGTIASPYATISATGGGGGVSQIVAGTGITISPVGGTGVVTINATGGGVTTVSLNDTSTVPIYTTAPIAATAGAVVETITLKTQAANLVFAGPASGSAAQPTFRPLVTSDLPSSTLAVPGTIPDLQFWWESDNILGSAGSAVTRLQERTPWIGGLAASASGDDTGGGGTVAVIDSTLQNGLPVLKWPAAVISGVYSIPYPASLSTATGAVGFYFNNGATYFIVAKGSVFAAPQAILGGESNALSLYLVGVAGTAKISLGKTGTAIFASSTSAWTPGSFFQANVTYNSTTGAFAFRQGRASAGSGTSTTLGAGANSGELTNLIGADISSSSFLNAASLAAILAYNRVLNSSEITNVENYLLAKWGV
jgi:hypothetical protein